MFSQIHFQSINVTDTGRALAFYTEKLGFSVHTNAPYGDDRWIFLQIQGAQTLLHLNKAQNVERTERPDLVLVAEDVDETCKTLESKGAAIEGGPDDAPWAPGTRWAMIRDSEGNLILIQNVKG